METPGKPLTGFLGTVQYLPPTNWAACQLDIVTPTRGRVRELMLQAERVAAQLWPADKWIIVDDAGGGTDPGKLCKMLERPDQLLHVAMSYWRAGRHDTVNRARAAGCALARPDSWVVEIDDHDWIEPGCLGHVRDAICRGAVFIYGDVQWCQENGTPGERFAKPDYWPYLFREEGCQSEGVRAYPKWLYDAVGGYRWHGPNWVGGNEFPAGDFGLALRMESLCEGQGFHRIPRVLNLQPKAVGSISTRYGNDQFAMAVALREAAKKGEL